MPIRRTLDEILTEAVADFEANGYDSQDRLDYWAARIREALRQHTTNQAQMDDMLKRQLGAVFERAYKTGNLKRHVGVSKFTLQNLAPRLRGELNRRILASANLIKLNRDSMIEKTLQRFSGWATSVPKGGSRTIDKREVRAEVAKPLKQLSFQERRVLIDQGHKLTASINAVVAQDGGAIGARWSSHWRQAGYNYREDHKDRDGHVYLVRDSWAHKAGLVKAGKEGYSDDITQPGEEVFCRCSFVYLYNLRQLPDAMLTAKGKEALAKARAA